MRICRLSKTRRLLGFQGVEHPWSDAEKIAVDANYMAVDIVINWAAEGLVLCFLHAVVDLAPSDNDPHWCGTTGLTQDQLDILYRRLLICVPQPSSMSRVFQILSNQPGRPLLISWPPDQGPGHAPTSKNFAKLAEDVEIGRIDTPSSDAGTSCTRRYKAMHTMSATMAPVESVYIPHGTSREFALGTMLYPGRSHLSFQVP